MKNIWTNLELNLELYKKIFLIRRVEEYIQREYPNDEMKTPMHMSMGEEAIVVGITYALRDQGLFFGTYRSHALYLATSGEISKFFAELYGKASGVSAGRAGSMHLACPEKGLILTSAVVGTTIPVAVGSALASKLRKGDKISVSFFGDGAVDEGVFWESLNAACLWKLPIIFVCEDNKLAIEIPTSRRRGYRSLSEIISRYNCLVLENDTTDVKDIYQVAQKAAAHIDNNGGPVFINMRYCRYLEHVGIGTVSKEDHGSKKEYNSWLARDPLAVQKEFIIKKFKSEDKVTKLEKDTNFQIAKSIRKAKLALLPNKENLSKKVLHDR